MDGMESRMLLLVSASGALFCFPIQTPSLLRRRFFSLVGSLSDTISLFSLSQTVSVLSFSLLRRYVAFCCIVFVIIILSLIHAPIITLRSHSSHRCSREFLKHPLITLFLSLSVFVLVPDVCVCNSFSSSAATMLCLLFLVFLDDHDHYVIPPPLPLPLPLIALDHVLVASLLFFRNAILTRIYAALLPLSPLFESVSLPLPQLR